MWSAIQDRLHTRYILSKCGMDLSSIPYMVCNVGGETLDHILFFCELACSLWALVARWCNIMFPDCAFIKEWLSWVDDHRGVRRHRLKLIVITTIWMLWRFQNFVTFEGGKIKKSLLFDNVALFSFSWLKNRDSNSNVVWNSWLMCPI